MNRLDYPKSIALVISIVLMVMVAACGNEPAAPTAPPTRTPTPTSPTPNITQEATDATSSESGLPTQLVMLDDLAALVAQRTPMPTRAPGPIKELAQDIAEESGLDETSFLGLPLTSWIDMAISILIIVLFVYVGLKLLMALLKAVVRRTKTSFDNEFLAYIERELRWFIAILVAAYAAVLRLDFLSDRLRILLEDIFYLLALGVFFIIVLRLIYFTSVWYRRKKLSVDQRVQLGPFIEMVMRLGYLLASILALSALLSHFGVEITMLSATILFAGVILILGARAAVSDAISGFIILVSQPFRVNDTVYIKELDTRGEVERIGIRTTHISTRDGREVIVPNSLIGASQVVNYTYPDPNFRVEIEFLTDGGDLKQIEQVIEEAVRGVEGVLPDQPVDILYLSFGGTGRQLRVRWWVDDVNKHNRIRNLVNAALDRALEEAGIETPNLTYDLNLKAEDKNNHRVTQ